METQQPSIEVHLGMLPGIDRQGLAVEFSGFQSMFFDEFGIIIPAIAVQEDSSLPDNVFLVYINNQAQPSIEGLEEGEFWVYTPASQLQDQQYFDRIWLVRQSVEPNSGSEAAIVCGDEADMQLWADSGADTRSRQGFVVFSVAAQIRKQPAAFFTMQLLHYYLTRLNENYPDLVAAATELLEMDVLYNTLQSRLMAGESIQNLPGLLEELLVETI